MRREAAVHRLSLGSQSAGWTLTATHRHPCPAGEQLLQFLTAPPRGHHHRLYFTYLSLAILVVTFFQVRAAGQRPSPPVSHSMPTTIVFSQTRPAPPSPCMPCRPDSTPLTRPSRPAVAARHAFSSSSSSRSSRKDGSLGGLPPWLAGSRPGPTPGAWRATLAFLVLRT